MRGTYLGTYGPAFMGIAPSLHPTHASLCLSVNWSMVVRSFTRLMKIKKHSHFPACVVLEHESMVVTSELWLQTIKSCFISLQLVVAQVYLLPLRLASTLADK